MSISKLSVKQLVMFAAALSACGPGANTNGAGDEPLATVEQNTICGTKDDSQFVNDYRGNLGPTKAFVKAHQGPVGAMETTAGATSSKFCSGTMISADLFITAGHCADSTTVGEFVAFNYERAAGSATLLAQSHFRISAVVEDALGGLDYAILRLEGKPGNIFGITPIRTSPLSIGEAATIIGHPAGKPKMIESGTISGFSGDYAQYGNIDTLGGNSGSGMLDANGNLVIIHTNGGCTRSGGANSGVQASKIAGVSAVF
jgi:V8-like Glu-specific endopeptidase